MAPENIDYRRGMHRGRSHPKVRSRCDAREVPELSSAQSAIAHIRCVRQCNSVAPARDVGRPFSYFCRFRRGSVQISSRAYREAAARAAPGRARPEAARPRARPRAACAGGRRRRKRPPGRAQPSASTDTSWTQELPHANQISWAFHQKSDPRRQLQSSICMSTLVKQECGTTNIRMYESNVRMLNLFC